MWLLRLNATQASQWMDASDQSEAAEQQASGPTESASAATAMLAQLPSHWCRSDARIANLSGWGSGLSHPRTPRDRAAAAKCCRLTSARTGCRTSSDCGRIGLAAQAQTISAWSSRRPARSPARRCAACWSHRCRAAAESDMGDSASGGRGCGKWPVHFGCKSLSQQPLAL